MSLSDRWSGWRATPAEMRSLLIEASRELVKARLLVMFGLKRRLPALLAAPAPADPLPPVQLQRDIGYILSIAVKTVPWKSLCLPNAIAAKRMLARRGYGSTLRLGVGRTTAGDPHAHAWLEAGDRLVIGEDGMADVTPLPGITLQVKER